MTYEPLILIVEDEPKIAQVLVDFFTLDGFKTFVLNDGRDAIQQIKKLNPAAVILDLMLPFKDGLTICREVREFSQVPILMLTARVEEIDRLTGLGVGADDYICKPFFPREVIARVQTILRRSQSGPSKPETLRKYKNLQLDSEKFTCQLDEQDVELTPVEFRLLCALVAKPGAVLSRDVLMTKCYEDERIVSHRTIDSHMKNLRGKLNQRNGDSNLLHSVYGVGYKLE